MHFGLGVGTIIGSVGCDYMVFVSERDDEWDTASVKALMTVLKIALLSCTNCSRLPQLCCRYSHQGRLFAGPQLCAMCRECTVHGLSCRSRGEVEQVFLWNFPRQGDVLCSRDSLSDGQIATEMSPKGAMSGLFEQSDVKYNPKHIKSLT
jgi:hypothetical protein